MATLPLVAADQGSNVTPVDDLKRNVGEASGFLKLLANPDRLMIVCCLVDGERSVSEIEGAVGLPQPRLSQQLAALRQSKIIVGRRNAKSMIYRIADDRAERIIAVMHELFCAAPDRLADAEGLH